MEATNLIFTIIIVILIGTYWILIWRLNKLIKCFQELHSYLGMLKDIKIMMSKAMTSIQYYSKQMKQGKLKVHAETPIGKIAAALKLKK